MRTRLTVAAGLSRTGGSPGCESPKTVLATRACCRRWTCLHTGEWSLIPPPRRNTWRGTSPSLQPQPGVLAYSASRRPAWSRSWIRRAWTKAWSTLCMPLQRCRRGHQRTCHQAARDRPDRLWGFASLWVDRWAEESEEQLAALEAALEHPQMIGIKIAHAHMHFRMDDPDYYGIYEVAEKTQAPVYLHTGPSPFPGTLAAPPPTRTRPTWKRPFPPTRMWSSSWAMWATTSSTTPWAPWRPAPPWPRPRQRLPRGQRSRLPRLGFGRNNYQTVFQRIQEEGLVDRLLYGSDGPQFQAFCSPTSSAP